MTLLLRALALLGSISYGLDRIGGRLLGLLPVRVPAGVILALLLGAAAWGSVQETSRAIAARPLPLQTTIDALVEDPTAAWVSVSGILSGPHLDNEVYASDRTTHFMRISDDPHDHVQERGREPMMEPGRRQTIFQLTEGDGLTRWFYVLRDPDGAGEAIVVRSARSAEHIRTRSIEVRSAGRLAGLPHLVEVADAATSEPTALVSGVPDGEGRIVRAALGEGAEVACSDGSACRDGRSWRYRVTDAADPNQSGWVDSPHPPNGQPVTLNGVVTTDAARMEIVLATNEMQEALAGLRHPTGLVLADGIGPLVPEVSYLGAVLLGLVGAVLLASAAVPYPIFRRTDARRSSHAPRPVVDELIPVDVDGQAPGSSGPERLRGASATIGWLPPRELARRAWHLRRDLPQAGDDRPRLALLAVEGNFVVPIDPIREQLDVESGVIATGGALRPGLRLTAPGLRLTLAFAAPVQRDRVHHELTVAVEPPPAGPLPVVERRPRSVGPAWARPATAAALALAGVLAVSGGILALLANDAAPIGAGMTVAAGAALGALAVGVARHHPLSQDLLPSVALFGLVVASVMVPASVSCGTWLTPNLAGCDPVGPLDLVPPLAGVVAFAFTLWALPRLARGHAA
jgi:hypothetical protein